MPTSSNKINSKRSFIGLDIGSSSAKAVLLEKRGKDLLLNSCDKLSFSSTELLSEQEYFQELNIFLDERNWLSLPYCLGLPQYTGSVTLSDFPLSSKNKIHQLVEFETQQLSGVSDENFIYDYQIFPAAFSREIPVLLAMCNEASLQERLTFFKESVPVKITSANLNSLALLNAFIDLMPEQVQSKKPYLLLDFGESSTTLLICAADQLLFTSTLSFATSSINKVINSDSYRDLGNTLEERLKNFDLMNESSRSSIIQSLRFLEDEIQQAVEHWRSVEKDELAKTAIDSVFICGGASKIKGIIDCLQDFLEVSVQLFAPLLDGKPAPEYTTAYGLALQSANTATVKINLLPKQMLWEMQRKARFPFLVAALIILFSLSFGWQIKSYLQLSKEIKFNIEHSKILSTSGNLTQELDYLHGELEKYEAEIALLTDPIKNMTDFQQLLKVLAEAVDEDCWLIYIGDEESFLQEKKAEVPTKNQSKTQNLFAGNVQESKTEAQSVSNQEFRTANFAEDNKAWQNLICAGFVPFVASQPYEQLRSLIAYLQEKSSFSEVDILPEQIRTKRETLFLQWQQLFRELPEKHFRNFALKIPVNQSKKNDDDDDDDDD